MTKTWVSVENCKPVASHWLEKFDDTKRVIKSRKSNKDIHNNGEKKKESSDLQNDATKTRTPLKTGDEHMITRELNWIMEWWEVIALTCENQTSVQSRKERVSFHPYLFSQTLYLYSIFYVTFELHILCSDDESSIYLSMFNNFITSNVKANNHSL